MYSAHTLQVDLIIKNVLRVIEQENGHYIETTIHSEVSFQTIEDRKIFYNSYRKHVKYQRTSHNHIKVPTVYFAPIFFNILIIHLLSAFSFDPDPKYITSGMQQS